MDNPQDKINALLSDPENLKTLARIASGFMAQSPMPTPEQPQSDDGASAQTVSDNTASDGKSLSNGQTEKNENAIPTISGQTQDSGLLSGLLGPGFKIPGDVDKSIVLLNALKPYLGNHKRETCELVVRLLGAAKLLGMYKIG